MFLKAYAEMFEPGISGDYPGGRWFSASRQPLWKMFHLGRAYLASGRYWFGNDKLPREIDFLFVSHLVNASHTDQKADFDFYYGELPGMLARRGYSVVVALINHTHQQSRSLAQKFQEGSVPRLLLAKSLDLAGELSIQRRLKRESRCLKERASEVGDSLFGNVLKRASREAMSGASQTTLRIGEQVAALVRELRPRALVVTHEGHAWERVAFALARRAVPEVRCVGYQHAAIFRLQHAIRRGLGREYGPDVILTAGEVARGQLQEAPGLDGILISVLGSNRSGATCAKDASLDLHDGGCPGKLKPPVCLVLPEGTEDECNLLFAFSLTCARACPMIVFVWRLHPLLSFDLLISKNPQLKDLPENIRLSTASFEEDIARSRWALYRGTTAIVQAVLSGVRPIYFARQGEMTIDPLYELTEGRAVIFSVADFQRSVAAEDLAPDSDAEELRTHCGKLFTPLDPTVMEALIA